MLRLHDSLANDVRELQLRDPGRVSMYVCGPTVYDFPHLGHGRFTLVWDTVRRWLTFSGLDVTFVSNITDVDDKIIARALSEGTTEAAVAAEYEGHWWDAMASIGVARPNETPHATAYVPQMVALINELLASGKAYTTSDSVYLDVAQVPDYGSLSGQPLENLRAGSRVEANPEKRSQLDFALWKKAKPGEPSWPAPFGDGRPGWHTECVVMSLELLGEGFDLHCGGFDLRFPHHENERAQALAAGRVFAQHWSHNGWVMVGDQKMSKSLKNFRSLTDLIAVTDQRAYRLLVLRSHYRSPIEVSPETIADAERGLERLDALARRFQLPALAGDVLEVADNMTWGPAACELRDRVVPLLDDDLDTPGALGLLFEALTSAHAAADRGDHDTANDLALGVAQLLGALGLTLRGEGADVDEASAALARTRDEARSAKNWALADQIRDQLVALGWTVEDGANGTVLRK